ncbi:YpdA family putative bacillithiol disulfide reductase [Gracilibacillus caseinilyticus]|uniref:YpdA family putative bacillithiol disulfide reductase n=1 Tax=Gracilibacillus caseinilyticus TaxID=2932256 RepID=A0ABY4ET12_9BACI|nr:YpdA family putative bacillithiol disulfide reductase [Gracilibacillus caseinilyticus]UOQ47556.1 YpdA family putative bacillithiol disulfide reductase [Gracilibacillus caseinilyticus]
MQQEKAIVIGAGPCGMSAAIELQNIGIDPLLIEKGNIVDAIYQYPTHQTFFSSSDKLEIGDVAFVTEKNKPVRNQALAYYRTVAIRKKLRINSFEEVIAIEHVNDQFEITTTNQYQEKKTYHATYCVIATGYYGQPNYLGIKGEELDKVHHYFKEAHPFYQQNVVVIGGKNSAVDATIELHKAGANVTVLYRGSEYSKSVKPWILPEFASLVNHEKITMEFNAEVEEISTHHITYHVNGERKKIDNDFVFAMTGYRPNHPFLEKAGISIEEDTGKPAYQPSTMETNVENIYIAGVIAAGFDNNGIFIENGRFHGGLIAASVQEKENS